VIRRRKAVIYLKRGGIKVDVAGLRREIVDGTLSDQDRAAAEALCPGICGFATGEIKRLPVEEAHASTPRASTPRAT
jgi:hypothetical protein